LFVFVVVGVFWGVFFGGGGQAGLEITADQRSMIGWKLFLIGEEARLPFILIGRNRFDHCLKDMLTCTR
jgi:hypothetical protein